MGERLIGRYREGFGYGESPIVSELDTVDPLGFDFSIVRLRDGEQREGISPTESVWVLMGGEAQITCGDRTHAVSRVSLFDEPPTAISLPRNEKLSIHSTGETEWAVARTENERAFAPRVFLPSVLQPEYRGRGLVQDMSLRNVRLIFDIQAHPLSQFVVGEVVNYPGRWSSYPPHHHPQPELYHYRFTEPQGYGHAELGEQVFKVRQNDAIKIMGGESHSQCAAPGYGMYYLWIIRHLPGQPYRGFEFVPEHRWLLDPANQGWRPPDEDD